MSSFNICWTSFCISASPLWELAVVLHTWLRQLHGSSENPASIWGHSIGSPLCQLQQTGICYHATRYRLYTSLWFALAYQSMPGLDLGCMTEWWYEVGWLLRQLCSCQSYRNQLQQKSSVHRLCKLLQNSSDFQVCKKTRFVEGSSALLRLRTTQSLVTHLRIVTDYTTMMTFSFLSGTGLATL